MTTSITTREPMQLNARNVEHIFFECLTESLKYAPDTIKVQGINITPVFRTEKLNAYRTDIISMLEQLPDTFHVGSGDGWTFLNMCIDRNGVQWTDFHRTCDYLLCLGIAIDAVEYTIKQRDLWRMFPGGMPYITINTMKGCAQ